MPVDQTTDNQTQKHGEDYKSQDYSIIFGPDKKTYKFPKGTTQKQADKYFAKKGIKESSGVNTPEKDSLLSAITSGKVSNEVKKKLGSAALDYTSASLPSIFGMGYGASAGAKSNPVGVGMSALGGGAGEAANQLIQRIAFSRDPEGNPVGGKTDTSYNAAKNIAYEAAKQGGLEAGGRAGAMFFRWLPHVQIKNGIPLLPSDIGGGKISKYVEDFLSNVLPSAGIMKDFKESQSKTIEKAARDLAYGFSKFTGDSKVVGKLVKETLDKADEQLLDSIVKKQAGTSGYLKYLKTGKITAQSVLKSPEYKAYVQTFKDSFIQGLVHQKNPETIAGLVREAGSDDFRALYGALKEHPDTLNMVRGRILKDILAETITKSPDPVRNLKMGETFSGNPFVHKLDEIGDARLKDLFGDVGYKSIKDFTDTVKRVSGGSGAAGFIGKFYNLTYILGPLRGTNMAGVAVQGAVLRTLAKIISSPEGVEAINQYVRATAAQSPKLINLATEEYKKQSDRAYKEQKIEEQIIKNHFENQGKGI